MSAIRDNLKLAASHARLAFAALPRNGKIAVGVLGAVFLIVLLRGLLA